jgi:hypothetical protein
MKKRYMLLITLCAVFTGCAPKVVTNTVYKDVYIPVRCNVTPPPRPQYNPNPVLGVVDILEYVEKLELLLKTCTEGNENEGH